MSNLSTQKIGFIGGGKMGEAIFSGLISSIVPKENLYVADVCDQRLQFLKDSYGVHTFNSRTSDIQALLDGCNIIVLAITPQVTQKLLLEIGAYFDPKKHLAISIIGGIELSALEELLPQVPVIRVMPNTPMLVKEGAAGIALGTYASKEDGELALEMFRAVGRAYLMPESLIDPLTSVSGCGPAYAYMFMEAMADGGVAMGLPRQLAIELAAQTLMGAAKMVLETGMHPGQLKDNVCSPGGATIAGVHALEFEGLRGAVIKGVVAGVTRMKEVAKESC